MVSALIPAGINYGQARFENEIPIKDGEPVPGACVCEAGGLWAAFRADLGRYESRRAGLLSQGLWATTAYRLSHYARYRLHSRLSGVLAYIFQRVIVALTGIDIIAHAHIGPGLYIPHGGYIVVGGIRAGRNWNFYQGVTLGNSATTFDNPDFTSLVPTLGDGVWVFPGAVIAGGVTLGDDAAVSANSLVVRDVPPGGVVMGVPGVLGIEAQRFPPRVDEREIADDERNASSAVEAARWPCGAR